MKKSLIALAALAATGVVSAQSTVTIDGVVDVGVRKLSSGVAAADTGAHIVNSTNNQIRFRVSEDLGGGLRANAIVAMRFDPTNGYTEGGGTFNGRALFQGETTIGLSGGFGSFKLGRSLTPAQAPLALFGNPWGTDTVAAVNLGGQYHTDRSYNAYGDSTGGQGRTDHIQYTSPNFSGLTVSVGYGFKQRTLDSAFPAFPPAAEVAAGAITKADQDPKDLVSMSVSYAQGPLSATLVHEKNRGFFGVANSQDKITGLGVAYNLGVARAYFGYAVTDFGASFNRATAAVVAAPANEEKAYALGADIPMGPSTFKVGYRKIDNRAGGTADSTKLGLGVYYALSKRTTAYTNYGSEKRTNETSRRKGFDVGLRHSF